MGLRLFFYTLELWGHYFGLFCRSLISRNFFAFYPIWLIYFLSYSFSYVLFSGAVSLLLPLTLLQKKLLLWFWGVFGWSFLYRFDAWTACLRFVFPLPSSRTCILFFQWFLRDRASLFLWGRGHWHRLWSRCPWRFWHRPPCWILGWLTLSGVPGQRNWSYVYSHTWSWGALRRKKMLCKLAGCTFNVQPANLHM